MKVAQPDDRGWSEHMLDAEHHDQSADEHEVAAHDAELSRSTDWENCGDPMLNDVMTSWGSVPRTTFQPCFDLKEEAAIDHRYAAQSERQAARHDRQTATALVHAELAACGGIPARERDHSAFAHRAEIAEVIPHREAGQVLGVRIVFKPVVGMNATWLRRDISCQQARWAVLGKPENMATDDPTLVPGAQTQVFDRGDHLEVLVTTDNTDSGEMAVARARLAAPQTQTAVR